MGIDRHPTSSRGFTLIETLVALTVLAFAIVGAFAGIIYSSRDLREGQMRQYKMVLLDAKAQRILLANKAPLAASAITAPTISPDQLVPGTLPWGVDGSTWTGDLGTGTYFRIHPNGQIDNVDIDITIPVPCNDPSLPDGTFCREVLVTSGLPSPDGGVIALGAQVYTQWTRVSRKNELPSAAVIDRQVFVQ